MYSDADIVLSSDWVPPLTIAPALSTDTKSQVSSLSQDTVSTQSGEGRKKTSSVSFSVDDNENQNSGAEKGTGEVKKNKVSWTPQQQTVSGTNREVFLDVEALIISTVMGRGIDWRARQVGHRVGAHHQRLHAKRVFQSIFKVIDDCWGF